MKSMFARLLLVGLLAAAVAVSVATSANAWPSGCYASTVYPNRGWSWCRSGTGQHRVQVQCRANYGWWTVSRYGPWRYAGETSWAYCPWGYTATGAWLNLQG